MFASLRDRIVTFFKSLSRTSKILLITGMSVGIVLLTFLILFLTKTEYVTVANGLDVASARVITAKLDELGIQWKEDGNLTAISVPKKDVAKARMELAATATAANISWSTVFGADSLTMTTGTREQMYVQALTSEIKSSIETISGISSAKVILQIPKESNYFLATNVESKASVVLTLKGPGSLKESSVQGIVNLMVSSVRGLTAENVTILDQTGRQLNDPQVAGDEFNANNQYDLKVTFERGVEDKLVDLLGTIYGKENVGVKVNAVLDFDKETETRTLYSPPIEGEINGIVRSATRIKENVKSEQPEGVPGVDSNPATSTTEGDQTGAYEKASETLNYELNQSIKHVEKALGQVKEMSVAVLVNAKVIENQVMTPEHKTELVSMISLATNTPKEKISVVTRQFTDVMSGYDVFTDDTAAAGSNVLLLSLIAGLGLALVLLILFMILSARKRKKAEEEAARLAELAEIEKETEEIAGEIGEKEDKGSPKYHIERFIDKNPEAAVTLLRAWIKD